MNREIKFRIWDTKHHRWFQGSTDPESRRLQTDALSLFGETIVFGELTRDQHTDKHVGIDRYKDLIALQFTGLKDKNGVEIYEGDVVRLYGGHLAEVKWIEGDLIHCVGFIAETFKRSDTEYIDTADVKNVRKEWGRCEVIGNIYENPELLKEDK